MPSGPSTIDCRLRRDHAKRLAQLAIHDADKYTSGSQRPNTLESIDIHNDEDETLDSYRPSPLECRLRKDHDKPLSRLPLTEDTHSESYEAQRQSTHECRLKRDYIKKLAALRLHEAAENERIENECLKLGRLEETLVKASHDQDHHDDPPTGCENPDMTLEFDTDFGKSVFSIHEVCGKGISSVVRRCTEKNTGKEYAVKIIDISGEKMENYLAEQTKNDTIREINILRMCTGHEQIIELHDSFETPTFIFLVFELCKHGELFDYLTQVVTLSEKRTRIIMKQLFSAVEYLHGKNIVHRDLKPENILLDDSLNVKVSDFGFAMVLGPDEELTELCGTPGYLAPEVLQVSMYDDVPGYRHEVDLWACGVIMYTLLCGAPPFWHRKQMQMLRMIMQGKYSFGSPEWDDISTSAKDLIANLLVVDPKKRLTAKEALVHPFFKREEVVTKKFMAKRHFKVLVLCITFFHRLKFFYNNPPPISTEVIKTDPYSVKNCRKLIDGCAFKMYGHWVKKADNQNRAALFEHIPREEWQNEFPR